MVRDEIVRRVRGQTGRLESTLPEPRHIVGITTSHLVFSRHTSRRVWVETE